MQSWDVIVVGAGIAGASVAWRLAGTARVLLLERETQPGYHSTGRSAAMFMEGYGPPGVRALTRASFDFYRSAASGLTDGAVIQPREALFLARPGEQAALHAMHAELARHCPAARVLPADEVLARVPVLRPPQLMAALLDPTGQDIDVHALHQGFLRGLRQRGGSLRTGAEVLRARRDAPGWQVELADGQVLRAPVLVNAAGAWADELAQRAGVAPIGLVPKRRSAFTFRPPDGLDVSAWPMFSDLHESWYVKPDAGQLLGSPANTDPVPPHDVQPEELDIALGIHRIQEATTLQIHRPTATWAGLRSFVPDGEIVIGFDDACPGFFWLAAQGGYGIQSAAGASLLAASLIEGAPLPGELRSHGVDPAILRPSRLR
jgi:D-arginine dehydrogenase